MAMPANVTTVVVRGTFITPEGDPSTGTVTFTPSSWLLNSGANIAIPNSAVSKSLGTAGEFSVTLPITDDADLSPTGWVYSVSEVVDGVSQSYNISIPGTVAAGGTVYLADLTPVAAAGPEYYSLASSLSIGTVTTLAAGSAATASITGLAPSQTLNLGVPQGLAASVSIGTVTGGTPGGTPAVTNSGTSGSAVLDFVLVPGQNGVVLSGTAPASPYDGLIWVDTDSAIDFYPAATISLGTVGSVAYPGPGTVTNSGTSGSAILNFTLVTGPTGTAGSAATIAVGTVTSVANSGTASVTNVGSSTAGTFNFVLKAGPTGPTGATGATGPANPSMAALAGQFFA